MPRKPQPAPAAPPFEIGARLRYVGTDRVYTSPHPTDRIALLEPGMVVQIVDTKPGRRGTGAVLDSHDDGEPIYDITTHGHSVYVNAVGKRRIIWPSSSHLWVRV